MAKIKKGLFITFEGGEGSGKSSLIASLSTFLKDKNLSFLSTREPGGTPLSEEIRPLILHQEMSSYTELALYLAARAEHVDKVLLPALKEGLIILCDRFNDSTVAYQGYARKLDVKTVKSLCSFFSQNLNPQITFYLDIDPEIGLKRASRQGREGLDRLEKEKLDFHQTIRKSFHQMAEQEKERFCVIDGSLPKEKVLELALAHLRKKDVI